MYLIQNIYRKIIIATNGVIYVKTIAESFQNPDKPFQ